jgi:hypothetical protein
MEAGGIDVCAEGSLQTSKLEVIEITEEPIFRCYRALFQEVINLDEYLDNEPTQLAEL